MDPTQSQGPQNTPQSEYAEINQEINNLKASYEANKLTAKQLEKVISKFDSMEHLDKKQAAELFGRLNFYANQVRATDPAHTSGVNKKMRDVAKNHKLTRNAPAVRDTAAVQKLKSAVGKVKKLISHEKPSGHQTKVVSEEYWKEVFDKSHRSTDILNELFNEWKAYGHNEKEDFWEYLEAIEKSGVRPELAQASHIVYMGAAERAKYVATLGMEQNKPVLYNAQGNRFPDGDYMMVLGPDNLIYAAVKERGVLQHSSFFGGQSVTSAGYFVVNKGEVVSFRAHSGHYETDKLEIFYLLEYLEKMGIDISKMVLGYIEDRQAKKLLSPNTWRDYVNYKNGLYKEKPKIHPDPLLIDQIPKANQATLAIANTAAHHGGGIYDKAKGVVVPANPTEVDLAWSQSKDRIAAKIGRVPYPPTAESSHWKNTHTDPDLLHQAAERQAPAFIQAVKGIAHKTGTTANFGPQDKNAVKSVDRIEDKAHILAGVSGAPQSYVCMKITDALRGTVIIDHPSQAREVVEAIHDYAIAQGGKAVFTNSWANSGGTGPVGIEAKILLPGSDQLMAEVVIQFRAIDDGTDMNPKQYVDQRYSSAQSYGPTMQQAIAKLAFLNGMEQIN